jgi:ubiquinol-cytochrome c reductase iron-sulfur subunit
MTDDIDKTRREFLIKATTLIGAVGLVATAIPFVTSMLPSTEAEAAGAPIKVDISQIQPGEQKTVMWRGKPIWIVHRTQEEIDSLNKDSDLLRDPNSDVAQQPPYARNAYRSIKPEFLILVGVCTHLGCIPTYRPEPHSVSSDWPGGFFCTCHGSKFDMAGRVFKGVPAPINLEVPHYAFISDTEIIIGVDKPQEV